MTEDERTRRLSEALAPLGWNRVQFMAPWRAVRLWGVLTPTGGRLNGSPDALSRHEELMSAVATVLKLLEELSREERYGLDHAATDLDDLDNGAVPAVTNAQTSLEALIPGLLQQAEEHAHEKPIGKRNIAAYAIADALAEIYAIGRGKRPTASRRAIDGGPSGRFPKCVAAVYAELGLGVKDVYPPCREAKKNMSDDRFEALRRIHLHGEAAVLRHKISLASVN